MALQAAERAENNPNMPFLHSRGSRNMDAVRLLRHFQNAISSLFSESSIACVTRLGVGVRVRVRLGLG